MKKKILASLSVITLIAIGFVLHASLGYREDRILIKPKTIQSYFDSAYNENMIKAGFVGTNAAKAFKINKIRSTWREKGFSFYSDDEISQFLKDNDFILGESSRYTKNVPESAGRQIVSALPQIRHEGLVYTLTLTHDDKVYQLADKDVTVKGRDISWRSSLEPLSSIISKDVMKELSIPNSDFWELSYSKSIPIYVIGGANDFNRDGLHIIDGILKAIPPKDPVAVVKVSEGYIQIAQW